MADRASRTSERYRFQVDDGPWHEVVGLPDDLSRDAVQRYPNGGHMFVERWMYVKARERWEWYPMLNMRIIPPKATTHV